MNIGMCSVVCYDKSAHDELILYSDQLTNARVEINHLHNQISSHATEDVGVLHQGELKPFEKPIRFRDIPTYVPFKEGFDLLVVLVLLFNTILMCIIVS
jgi:hypothetical protein